MSRSNGCQREGSSAGSPLTPWGSVYPLEAAAGNARQGEYPPTGTRRYREEDPVRLLTGGVEEGWNHDVCARPLGAGVFI